MPNATRGTAMRLLVAQTIFAITAITVGSLAFAATTPNAGSTAQTTPATHAALHSTRQHAHHRHHDWGAIDKLDLTASQRSNIHTWTQQSTAAARAERKALMQKRKAFTDATPSTADYNTATAALADAEASAAKARVMRHAALRAKIYAELTPAQRTQLADLRAQRKTRMHNQRHTSPHHRWHSPAPATSSAASR